MVNFIEQIVFKSLFSHYPDWELTPYLVTLGYGISTKQAKFRFNEKLLRVSAPTIRERLQAGYAYARHEVLFNHEMIVKANADYLFQNCYIQDHQDALAFCRTVCFARYAFALAKKALNKCMQLCFDRSEGYKWNFDLFKVVLEVYYHEQIGEWLTHEKQYLTPVLGEMQDE
jgi:hypothetical protein